MAEEIWWTLFHNVVKYTKIRFPVTCWHQTAILYFHISILTWRKVNAWLFLSRESCSEICQLDNNRQISRLTFILISDTKSACGNNTSENWNRRHDNYVLNTPYRWVVWDIYWVNWRKNYSEAPHGQ